MHNAKLTILTAAIFLLTGLLANAAVIHGSLQAELDRLASGETVAAIVFFKHQADIESLNKQLKVERATLAERHYRVETALQEAATQAQPSMTAFLEQLKSQGLVTEYKFYWVVNAFHVTAYPAGIRALTERQDLDVLYPDFPVESIEPVDSGDDGSLLLGHEIGLERINAPAAWAQGWTGVGRVVMNIDTGVDGTHPALADRFRGDVDGDGDYDESWYDPYTTHWNFPQDSDIHGTHTMGTICGRSPSGDTIGVAIDAQWIAAAAIDRGGGFSRTIADVLLSFEWAVDPDGDPETQDNPDAIGNSWGIPDGYGYPDCDETFWQVIDNVEAAGSVVIFSAGNEASNGLRSPADRATTLYNVFSVGAVDGNSSSMPIAYFSARGPSECAPEPPLNIKPEVVAPGVNVRSSIPGGNYTTLSGTSMASPHITGAVAVLRQVNPDLDADSVKAILIATAEETPADGFPGEDNTYGNGIINLYEACLLARAGYGVLLGHVTDSDDNAIRGARVQIPETHWVTNTNQDGFYSMAIPGDTTYTVRASAFSYMPEEAEVFVTAEDTTTADFVLQRSPTGSLHGTVISEQDSSAVVGADVEVVDTSIDPVQTDDEGYYEFPDIPGGSTYTISVTASGFGIGQDDVFIPEGGDAELNFVLIPFESFEDDNAGWLGEGVWEWGAPTSGPGSAFDGTNVWATNLDGNYRNGIYEMLASSYFQVDDPSAVLSFYHWYEFERGAQAFDGGNVSVRVLGEEDWDIISPVGGYPEASVAGLNGEPGYSGSTGDWVDAEFDMGAYEGDIIQIGFRIGTDGSTAMAGWYLDAVAFSGATVLPYPHIEVAPTSFHVTLEQGQSTTRNLTISNPTDGFLYFAIDPQEENRLLDGSEPYIPLAGAEGRPAVGKYAGQEGPGKLAQVAVVDVKPKTPDEPANPPMTLGSGGPDEYGYRWVDSDEPDGPAYGWVDITGVGTPVPLADDDISDPIDMGFEFSFYGQTYSQFWICSNGFGAVIEPPNPGGHIYFNNLPFPSAPSPGTVPAAAVAPFWDDLNPEDGGTVYEYAANDSFIVAWVGVSPYSGTGDYTFEMILTAAGKITFQYNSMTGTTSSATVGIQNEDGTIGLQMAYNQGYVVDGLAVRISPPLFWLSADPLSGFVTPNSSAGIDVSFDASNLEENTYTGYLAISSNDPDEPSLAVPCTLTVVPQTGIDDETAVIPDEFGLEQNYPNPFNPSTSIGFALPQPSDVSLTVYDLLGRRVRNLYSGDLEAGYHRMLWDGTDDQGNKMPSGVYFYRLTAGELQQSRKMLMLK